MKDSRLAERILPWYSQHARNLPWREHPDPYAVWVSEVMLQQTRVETVRPYFERWMQHFPSIAALAQATQQEVLAVWEGLGYYSRARNLHKAAQIIVAEHSGELPADPRLLRKLPGIGRYSAGAIASIAFQRDEAALDGNIRRVLARVYNVREPIRSKEGERRLWELATNSLPRGQASEYNQALMDLGATICTPRLPDCPACPLAGVCEAQRLGLQDQLPVVESRPPVPHVIVTAALIERSGRVLITQRPPHGLLGGLWEFPGGKVQPGEDLPACLEREIREELNTRIQVGGQFGVYHHAYTHFRVTLHAFRCTLLNGGQPQPIQVNDLRWVEPGELASFPMGKIDRQIARGLAGEKDKMLL